MCLTIHSILNELKPGLTGQRPSPAAQSSCPGLHSEPMALTVNTESPIHPLSGPQEITSSEGVKELGEAGKGAGRRGTRGHKRNDGSRRGRQSNSQKLWLQSKALAWKEIKGVRGKFGTAGSKQTGSLVAVLSSIRKIQHGTWWRTSLANLVAVYHFIGLIWTPPFEPLQPAGPHNTYYSFGKIVIDKVLPCDFSPGALEQEVKQDSSPKQGGPEKVHPEFLVIPRNVTLGKEGDISVKHAM